MMRSAAVALVLGALAMQQLATATAAAAVATATAVRTSTGPPAATVWDSAEQADGQEQDLRRHLPKNRPGTLTDSFHEL